MDVSFDSRATGARLVCLPSLDYANGWGKFPLGQRRGLGDKAKFFYSCRMADPLTAERAPYMAVTRGIAVSVEPTFLEAQSSPGTSQYFWAYRVTIENQGRVTVQLLSRHWRIMNSRGEVNEVKGAGVVGEQPILKPGESFEYTSGAPLSTPSGIMTGTYQMESEGGERFDIAIPSFSLDSPQGAVVLN